MSAAVAGQLLWQHRRKLATAIVAVVAAGVLFLTLAATAVVAIKSESSCTAPTVGDLSGVTALAAAIDGRPVGFAISNEHGQVLAEHHGSVAGNSRSISKSLVLLALARLADDRPLSTHERRLAVAMIRVSDNQAANALIDLVGLDRVDDAATSAGMTGWVARTGSSAYRLGITQVTATDFARFFATFDDLLPRRHRTWATGLLADIRGAGRFGVLDAGIPGRVLSKGGWMPETATSWTVNQAAQFSVGGRRYGVALILGDQPSFAAGARAITTVMRAAYHALAQPTAGNGADGTSRLPAGRPYTGPDFQTEASAYGPPWGGIEGEGITKSGFDLPDEPVDEVIPIVAVDRSRVPLGSLVYIWPNPFNRAGPFWALDIGGAIVGGNAIDFLIMSGREAQNSWGRKQVTVSSRPFPAAGNAGPLPHGGDCATAGEADTSGAPGLPSTATELQQRAVHYATAIESLKLPYCYGGGHGPQPGPSYIVGDCWNAAMDGRYHSGTGIDCSGAIRLLLVAMGYSDPGGIASGGFGTASYGTAANPIAMQPGPGSWMTIYYNDEHIYTVIAGRAWETSSSNTLHGPGWSPRTTFGAGYNVGHLPGM